jgi:TRAP-type mannitol/chloroaromatic compound transport system permease small subunit
MSDAQESITGTGFASQLSRIIDGFILSVGNAISWLNVVLVLVILAQVVLRYVFGLGQIFLEEAQWHLYAVLVMFGIAYGVVDNTHIRMDLIYSTRSERTKEWIELFGQVFFVMPFALILFLKGVDLVESAWRVNEGSPSPGGLPWRWAIRAVLPASMLLYLFASISRSIRSILYIFFRRA